MGDAEIQVVGGVEESPRAFAIRPGVEADRNFILRSWLKTLRGASHLFWGVANEELYGAMEPVAQRLIDRETTLVAHDPEDPGFIVGFVVGSPGGPVHMVYVRASMRRFGIASALLEGLGVDLLAPFTATTVVVDLWKGWMRARLPNVRLDPVEGIRRAYVTKEDHRE